MTAKSDSDSSPSTSASGGGGSSFSTPTSSGSGGTNVGTSNAGNVTAAPSGATIGTITKTTEPNISGLDKEGKAWTGGEPTDKNWKSTKSSRPQSGYAYRTGVDFRQYGACLKGMDHKFCFKTAPTSKDLSLPSFATEVKRHLVQHGMDSVYWYIG